MKINVHIHQIITQRKHMVQDIEGKEAQIIIQIRDIQNVMEV